jgi:DNA repair exonuclease SbcCD ATPase subunit
MQEWDKLLEKYAEYEYKVTQIQKEAERERETARKKGASQEILDAINNREKQELARVSFEEFQKTPEWIVATGDLANMSKSAIGMLIEQLEKYKRSAKNLSPKQIKQLNSALSKLYKEQRKNNPFKAISNMLDEAKERMATFDEDINKTQKEIDSLTNKKKESIVEGIADEETDNKLKKAIKRLKELKEAREKTGKVDASSWVSSINETIGAVQSAIGVFNDLAKAIGGVDSSDLDKVFSVVDKAGQGAAVGAQIGGGYGAIIGAVVGATTELISIFAGAENERINNKIKESELAVKRLELAYIDLEHAVNEAYGMATIGANMAAKANKELQLVELKRQLALERSRDSKNRDEDKIIDLQKQIKELEYDIADTVDSIVNDLLGISSVGDAMENMMDAFIEALRSGEDAMATFDESVDEMIANMVKKMFTTKILQPWFEEQWGKIQDQINERAGKLPNELAKVQSKVSEAKMADLNDNNSLVEALRALGMSDDQIHLLNWYNEFGQNDLGLGSNARLKAAYEKMLKEAEQKEAELQKELTTATMPTTEDIRRYAELLRSGQPIMEENMQEVANFLRELGLMKDDASKNLSALQQGIQGITEETAGAVEAYLNGMSQQAYLRNDLLVQIRDTIMSFDMDVQLGVFSQMLLQLQNNYIVMQSMQSMMEGWTTPSGQGIRVELLS